MGLPGAGEFVFDDEKFDHIDKKHGEQFRKLGFENGEAMARYVLESVERVYQAGNGALRFVRSLQGKDKKFGNLIAEFDVRKEGNEFRITTVFPVNGKFFKNKTPLWERTRIAHPEGSPALISGQSGIQNSINSGDVTVNENSDLVLEPDMDEIAERWAREMEREGYRPVTGARDSLTGDIARDMEELGGGNESHAEKSEAGKVLGCATRILNNDSVDHAHYEVWEMEDLIPSHDPNRSFERRPEYPAEAQERPYHSDRGEQEKVRHNAAMYEPGYTISTAASAMEGPPVITRAGIVLGGNSRAMTLQLLYEKHKKKAEVYRRELGDKASWFGLDPEMLRGMRHPVLVRVLNKDLSVAEMTEKSRIYNQTSSQKLQEKAEGVSRARMISPETLEIFAEALNEDPELTLRKYLDERESRKFIDALLSDGVIQRTELSSLTGEDGLLNISGKELVENALRGMVIPDYDLLKAIPDSILNKLDRCIPSLSRLKSRGGQWDLTPILMPAMRFVVDAKQNKKRIEDWFGQADMFDTDKDKKRPAVQALAILFSNATQKEMAARVGAFAEDAAKFRKNMAALPGLSMEFASPAAAFEKAFLKPLYLVGNSIVADFNPADNEVHAAIAWATENGAKSVEGAIAALQRESRKEISQEERETLRSHMGKLGHFTGQITKYEPNLGPYFRYRQGDALFQKKTLEQKLAQDIEAWEKRVDELDGKVPDEKVLMLPQTPLIMDLLTSEDKHGKSAVRGGVYASPHVFDSKHPNIDKEVLKQIPGALVNPIAVFDSETHQGDLVFMIDVTDSNGSTVVVPVALSKKGRMDSRRNIAKSVYAKDYTLYVPDEKGQKSGQFSRPNDKWFIEQIEKNARYINGQKFRDWLFSRASGSNSLRVLNDRGVSGTNLMGHTIYTEKDLVKLREQFGNNLYQGMKSDASGAMAALLDGRYFVALFEKADASTVLHELAHYFLETFRESQGQKKAPQWMKKAWQKLEKAYGFRLAAIDEAGWVQIQERFAREFEAYCREGKAPSPELQGAFSSFRKWLVNIYKSVRSILGLHEVNKDVRQVFDRLLATEAEIEESRRAMEKQSAVNLPGVSPELKSRYFSPVWADVLF